MPGDDFSVDQINEANPSAVTQALVRQRYTIQRPHLGVIGKGTPNSVAVWAQHSRIALYSQPAPDAFCSGNPEVVLNIRLLRNYFAWTWGDAPYQWLERTFEQSDDALTVVRLLAFREQRIWLHAERIPREHPRPLLVAQRVGRGTAKVAVDVGPANDEGFCAVTEPARTRSNAAFNEITRVRRMRQKRFTAASLNVFRNAASA